MSDPLTLEDRHLRRWPERLVHRTDRLETHRVAMSPRDLLGPGPELVPRPLEPVVGMPQLPGTEVLPGDVVLPVGRGQDHRAGSCELEDGPLERREPGRV